MTEKSNPVSIHALTDANIQPCDVGEILTAEQRALEHSEPDWQKQSSDDEYNAAVAEGIFTEFDRQDIGHLILGFVHAFPPNLPRV